MKLPGFVTFLVVAESGHIWELVCDVTGDPRSLHAAALEFLYWRAEKEGEGTADHRKLPPMPLSSHLRSSYYGRRAPRTLSTGLPSSSRQFASSTKGMLGSIGPSGSHGRAGPADPLIGTE